MQKPGAMLEVRKPAFAVRAVVALRRGSPPANPSSCLPSPASYHSPMSPESSVKIGAFAVLKDEQSRILLLHRNDRDQWCLPGGLFEMGESVIDCVLRECAEEIGVKITIDRLLGIYSDPKVHLFNLKDGNRVQYVTFVFLARITEGTPLFNPDESRGMQFFAKSALPPVVPSHRVWIEDGFEPGTLPHLK